MRANRSGQFEDYWRTDTRLRTAGVIHFKFPARLRKAREGGSLISCLLPCLLGGEEAEDADAGGGADVDLAVGDHRSVALVACTELISTIGRLVRVVYLSQGFGVVGVEDSRIDVLRSPDNGVLSGVSRDTGSRAGEGERVRRFRYRAGEQFRIIELKFENLGIHWSVVQTVIKCGGHRPDPAGQHAYEFLVNLIGAGIELAHVGSVNDVKVVIFASTDGELPNLAQAVFLAEQERPPGTQVRIKTVFGGLVEHLEVVGHGQTTLGGETKEGVAVVAVGGEARGIESSIENSISVKDEDVAAAIGSHTGTGAPEGAFAGVGSYVENGGLGQRARAIAHKPSGVGAEITVRGPGEINSIVGQKQAGTLFVLRGIEDDKAAGTVVASARILGRDFHGAIAEFAAIGGIEGMQALMVSAGAVFRHGHDVNDGIPYFGAGDDGSCGDSDLGLDLGTTSFIRSSFAGL